jgi:hypothetical protein
MDQQPTKSITLELEVDASPSADDLVNSRGTWIGDRVGGGNHRHRLTDRRGTRIRPNRSDLRGCDYWDQRFFRFDCRRNSAGCGKGDTTSKRKIAAL